MAKVNWQALYCEPEKYFVSLKNASKVERMKTRRCVCGGHDFIVDGPVIEGVRTVVCVNCRKVLPCQ